MTLPLFPSRRALLRQSALGFGALALTDLLRAGEGPLGPKAQPKFHFPPRAKRVIFLFMKGGPSHLDTFEPKPRLDRDDGKPYPGTRPRVVFAKTGNLLKSPWKFRKHGQCGSPVSELFPHVAGCVDDICFVHSLHGTNPAHGGAVLKLHTGSDNFVRPSMGAWVAYGLGTANASLPAFVTVCPTLAHGGVNNWGSAFLPASNQGVPLGNASTPVEKARVKYIQSRDLTPAAQRIQLDLAADLSRSHLDRTGPDAALEGRIESFELAFRMQAAMPEAEDLSRETAATHTLYGLDDPVTAPFGRQCLLARRLAERGVRFVQVYHRDWDHHGSVKAHSEGTAKEVDQGVAALLLDLKNRDMLKDTLIVFGTEFGRTPMGQGNGRDHHLAGFSMWMAGGGIKGGMSYGATDELGYHAVENKTHVNDLHATMLHLLGIDHKKLTMKFQGRDFRLTDIAGEVIKPILA